MDAFLEAARVMALQLPGLVILKDLNLRVLAINPALRTLLGLRADLMTLGRYESELAPSLGDAHDMFRAQDLETLQKRRMRFVEVVVYADQVPHVLLAEKVCIEAANGTAQAVLFQATDVTQRMVGGVSTVLLEHVAAVRRGDVGAAATYQLNKPGPQRFLSPRESECLFFVLRGQTARSIAQRMHLSMRTVEGYLERLKLEFASNTKASLIERALNEGYGGFLPATLLAAR